MARDARPRQLAQFAADLATGARVELPDSLLLWRLAGARPAGRARRTADPGWALSEAMEPMLDASERRQGAHHTPRALAERAASMALDGIAQPRRATVVDPTCGAGALLLAAGELLARRGAPRDVVARDLLWGADISPLATAVTEAAIALWGCGTAPARGHVVTDDSLLRGPHSWPEPPAGGFAALVGNPPFQGQLGRGTVRTRATTAALRRRFGGAVAPYVDAAALFLLAGTELVRPGGRLAMVLPASLAAARDARAVREVVAERASLVQLWLPTGTGFTANVHVCVALLEVGAPDLDPDWTAHLAEARGVPAVELTGSGTLADLGAAVAGFRDEYYGLVDHVREAGSEPDAPLVTSGCIDVGSCAWGSRSVRFAKRRWARPEVDREGLARQDPRTGAWVDRLRRPKVVVASQTRVVEAAVDPLGSWVPVTPVVSVLPDDESHIGRIAAALCAPPVAAWAARRAAGSGLSATAIRVSTALVLDVPLPADSAAWDAATHAFDARDLATYGRLATTMHHLPPRRAEEVLTWWTARLPRH